MATSRDFLSRWSKRKLEESQNTQQDANLSDETDTEIVESLSAEEAFESDVSEQITTTEESETTADAQEQKPEEMSIANLLVSEASESVKKAALRKLFLSEEFNVRDGLDDYDDDYSNLKSLSEGVAETLRDWVKDKTEDDLSTEDDELATVQADASDVNESEQDITEPSENTAELYKNTVPEESENKTTDPTSEQVGQNMPHTK
ncbi:DUF3306 domain-containing protein [Vibrio sp. EA2]|uniref:DUF3306 domain-containing protein n=1 Tax=Vibrio sp. EA2 TaxID=3079860 RepID=UPI0029494EF2|nr:DUF3306 domain-containing protein [Vibrio sp. EA2]MDV6251026.1 DUF3306 domain-containing protein [Vibrio sp. EA2]